MAKVQYVNSLNRGLAYAESCFETFRVIRGQIFAWGYHFQRLQTGMQSFGIRIPDAWNNMLRQHCITAASKQGDDALVRLSVSGGDALWGLMQQAMPQVYIQTSPPPATQTMDLQSLVYPFALQAKPAKFTADYAMSLRAIQHWRIDTPTSALICKQGHIISGLTANIALYAKHRWHTPEGDGVLAGTVRHFLLESGMIEVSACPMDMLEHTEAAVLLNAGKFIEVVHSIDGTPLRIDHPAIADIKKLLQTQPGVSFA